ncbi:MAG: hypothetical protein SAJ12_10340 [Jaaginema sp. PMC 1079.18]|nr:hypothetical protein [Jaaginema sp. PMC 1080.18]MEC4851399.1 hypothetical protein [Jaaginema sp. PMC 1079.18]MEC4868214.1 hypothetical protein [Jaaginema sp. PMC 1078.18]
MMKWIQPKTWQHHLACVTSTLALVGSAAIYKHQIEAQPWYALEQHWEAIASSNPQKTANLYSSGAKLKRVAGIRTEIYRGDLIYEAWQDFFSQYRIQDLQAIQPIEYHNGDEERGVRNIKAQLKIRVLSHRGQSETFLAYYQVQINRQGQILNEVWQTRPDFPL